MMLLGGGLGSLIRSVVKAAILDGRRRHAAPMSREASDCWLLLLALAALVEVAMFLIVLVNSYHPFFLIFNAKPLQWRHRGCCLFRGNNCISRIFL
jgi:hypothetical protein